MKYIALAFSDLHLSDTPYLCRSGEPDWMGYQRGLLRSILKIASRKQCPIVFAGDFFDRWKVSPALLNLSMRELMTGVHVYGIPGQHDLPEHRYTGLQETSFGSLVNAGMISCPPSGVMIGDYAVDFLPFGSEPSEWETPPDIVVLHDLVLKEDLQKNKKNLGRFRKKFKGSKLLICGDNHEGFYCKSPKPGYPDILNCGSSLRKTADQKDYQPKVYLITDRLRVEAVPLNISNEVFSTEHLKKNQKKFLAEAMQVVTAAADMDYPANLKKQMDAEKTPGFIRGIVTGVLNDC